MTVLSTEYIYRQSKDGQTALHVATRKGHTKCLKKLLEQGADINLRVSPFMTPFSIPLALHTYQCMMNIVYIII